MTRSKFGSLKAALLTGGLITGVTGAAQAEDAKWYDGFKIGGFVDAYGAIRSDNNAQHNATATSVNDNGTPNDPSDDTATRLDPNNVASGVANPGVVGPYGHDAYVEASGFALAFAGLDVAYSGEQFGATLSLRFGPGVNRFFGGDQGQFGIDNVTQAYATWKPFSKLTLDLGQFYTIYGAEVAESWRNQNYSRGGLYYAMQPFWHTGLRANIAATDWLAINALLVNGVNNAFEGNKAPSVGAQLLFTPIPEIFLGIGYLGGLTPRDGDDEEMITKNFQDFFDFVGTFTFGGFKTVLNADFNSYRMKGEGKRENWWGVSVAPGYSFTNWFGAAVRVEYLSDSANSQLFMATKDQDFHSKKVHMTTFTATLDFKPVANIVNLIIRPEFRYDLASDENFYKWGGSAPNQKGFWSAHLGAVVTSMP
jgi:hypothetical protein